MSTEKMYLSKHKFWVTTCFFCWFLIRHAFFLFNNANRKQVIYIKKHLFPTAKDIILCVYLLSMYLAVGRTPQTNITVTTRTYSF